ncbi:MAG TPA: DUF1549 domain-containing protein [Gemmataceae bacterium]|nr:DUF1549 domain-containing protein [Gemmataceae bacterium]
MSYPLPRYRWWLAVGLLITLAAAAPAQTPLHQRIDELIAAGTPDFERLAAPLADDAEFLRRVYLDLTGTIPPAAEARAFLNDPSPDKRRQLIDRLLASPEHARHMAHVFDVMLMERRTGRHVPPAAWHEYLRAAFAENKPWDELVREILSADGEDAQRRPAAKFYLDRDGEPHLLTRDISRLFLGMNLTCSQCHDSPIVEDYKQDLYYGIFAFLNRSFLFTPKGKPAVLAEKADGEATFQSVFDPAKVTKTAAPRLPGGPLVKEPMFEKGQEYEVAPGKDVKPVPKFSRRAQLAAQLTAPENVQFRRNIANRLWALMMGRGLIHPLDQDHSANPPSHPELLNVLADEIGAMKFNLRAFLRELALSKTYQRASVPPPGVKEVAPETFAVARLKPLSPEQLALAMMQATGLTDVERKALGDKLSEAALYAKLSGNLGLFVNLFGNRPGQPADFEATMDQALFVANGKLLRSWLAPNAAGNLTGRLGQIQEADAVAEELYLSVLTRLPTEEERREVADYLKERTQDRAAALQELAWALLASAEFRFNH